eukprot:TRINITY_DN719_c0_g2_i1.p1 TRINITY_DN719_c0_g2~~TRINITY_DN719_c0_g2_i1.p1  ORF type:complete len:809 (+),score=122.46 TRINITY_DN719_c0_g2_i1:62-2428(+)
MIYRVLASVILVACTAADNGLTVSTFGNGALSGTPLNTYTVQSVDISDQAAGGVKVTGTITFPSYGWHNFSCAFSGTSLAVVWVDGHMVCTDGKHYSKWNSTQQRLGDSDYPINIRTKKDLAFRAHLYRNSSVSSGSATTFSMKWALNGGSQFTNIPLSALTTELSEVEKKRDELQQSVQNGWSNWNQHSILDVVKLPESGVATTMLCNSNKQCITDTRIEPNRGGDCSVRVGIFAGDRSYVQFYFGDSSTVKGNVSVEYQSHESDLYMLITPQESTPKGTTIRLTGRFAWYRPGDVSFPSSNQLTFKGLGFNSTSLYVSGSASKGDGFIEVSLDNGPVVISSDHGASVSSVTERLGGAKEAHLQSFSKYGQHIETALAIEASAMWNLIYVPLENGPIFPVSRNWNFEKPTAVPDFNYAMFDWDNLFASLLGSLGSKELAYSNFIQTMKSKTADGFVPNFQAGGTKSQDRTEPPVGAKVLEELYKKFKDSWLIELVFDDLLDWQDFFLRERILGPQNLVCLGSFNPLRVTDHGGDPGNNMQDARYESGLDNSPMYDGEFFNTTTHKMMLYDVGMTSMVAQEAQSMANLAEIIGRPEASMLRQRSLHFKELMASVLWDEKIGTFSNKFPNGTFYERISPTTFYPLQVGAATNEQADAMVTNWLLNPKRFCISPTGDSAGNGPDCYWGLPSIQASDPAFPPLGYWRGYVWGPMAQLTYWGLQQYNTTIVNNGRKAMTKQLTSLMMSQWNAHRHICENYGPHKNTTDCTGTQFYHWGALTGLITIMEEGLW